MKQFTKAGIFTALVIVILLGCAAPPQLANMIVQINKPVFKSTGKSLKVDVVSGSPVAGGHEMFRQALIESFKNSQLVTAVAGDGTADYKLTAFIVGEELEDRYLEQAIGLTVKYSLYDESTKAIIFEKIMPNSYTGQAHVSRLREKAVQENIIFLMNEISLLQL